MSEHTPEKPACHELSWPHTQPDIYDIMHRQNSVEAWVAGHAPDDPYGDEDACDVTYLGEIDGEANARRLVACWNACQGIETETLEKAAEHGTLLNTNTAANVLATVARATEAERLLRGLARQHEGWQHGMGPCICEWHEAARSHLDGAKPQEDGK